MQQKNPLEESINNIRNFQKNMNEASANTEDVKKGEATKEEEQKEPAYILYNSIAESSVTILQSPTVQKTFTEMSEKMGDDFTKSFIEMLVVIMTNSAHSAITIYDELLKKELTNTFNSVGDCFATVSGDVNAHTGILEIFKKRLDEIENKLKLQEINKN